MYLFPFQDLYTGLTNQTFKTKYTSQHKIGGFLPVSLLSVQSHILCRIKKNEYKIFFAGIRSQMFQPSGPHQLY